MGGISGGYLPCPRGGGIHQVLACIIHSWISLSPGTGSGLPARGPCPDLTRDRSQSLLSPQGKDGIMTGLLGIAPSGRALSLLDAAGLQVWGLTWPNPARRFESINPGRQNCGGGGASENRRLLWATSGRYS
ncbi:hypothetical protein CENSYa_0480 [Cenarchaeum symbiosum A]|uniref:Uncharacterized protein n=1 Tax=Cenarchaeum symbiosum (strain A) TaxID=414004 RepID=A0RUU7_CENSY|nr:hypothetical protein CENSYa_0480 [Cenarchaeum symbiosum A]